MFGKLAVNESARQWEYRLEMSLGHRPKALLQMEERRLIPVLRPALTESRHCRRKRVTMGAGHPPRAEKRTSMRVLVEVCSFENASYELAYTINVSRRGARIISKHAWNLNQRLSVRSIEGNLNEPGRITYCDPAESNTFAIGVQ